MNKTHLNGLCAGRELYNLDIHYHDYGDIKAGRKIIGRYFKTDNLSKEQQETLNNKFSNVRFSMVHAQYAPEIQKAMVIFLTKAEVMRSKNA